MNTRAVADTMLGAVALALAVLYVAQLAPQTPYVMRELFDGSLTYEWALTNAVIEHGRLVLRTPSGEWARAEAPVDTVRSGVAYRVGARVRVPPACAGTLRCGLGSGAGVFRGADVACPGLAPGWRTIDSVVIPAYSTSMSVRVESDAHGEVLVDAVRIEEAGPDERMIGTLARLARAYKAARGANPAVVTNAP